jgi:hypothetical protein
VTTLDTELRDALALILGSPPPPAEGEALPFFGQWLAERNLGLVPIAEPQTFSWPGHWIARVRAANADHAVVMRPLVHRGGLRADIVADGTVRVGDGVTPSS